MNKFRNKLHATFFNYGGEGFGNDRQEYYRQLSEARERDEALRAEEAELMESIKGQNLPDIAGEVLADIPDDGTEGTAAKKEIFQHRIEDKPEGSDKTYESIWSKKIALGLGALITKLGESHYFDDCADQAAKDAKITQVKEQYIGEVKKEYKDKVYSSTDYEFNAVKNVLFDRDAEDSITNKMFKQLSATVVVTPTVSPKETPEETLETQMSEFSNVVGLVASEASSGYTDMELLKRDRIRFRERLKSKSPSGEEYVKVWEKKIQTEYDFLIKTLDDNGYFEDCKNETEKNQKKSEVLKQYSEEVKSQYEKYIWDGSNKKFERVKDTIFGKDSENYPANKIYCKLIKGAVSIFTSDRTYLEGYGAEILEAVDDGEEEKMSDRRNRKFLSKELPQYLWDLKKAPHNMDLLVASIEVNKPSREDSEAISDFLIMGSRINVKEGQDPAIVLLNALRTNRLGQNSGKDAYKKVLGDNFVKKEKYWNDLVKVGNFYYKTQSENNKAEHQHAVYLSILKIIETEGGAYMAEAKYRDLVDKSKSDKEQEKKDGGYKNGEILKKENSALFDLATKLGIEDFTNATRLQKKSPEYFTKFQDSPEKILANINNDNVLSALDTVIGGSKTGQQFIEVFNQVGKETALKNLLERAKLENRVLGLGLDENIFKAEEITKGNKKLILLLQNIISKPGEDLITLLGDKKRIEFDQQLLEKAKEQSNEVAKDMAGKIKLDELRQLGLTNLPQPEELQSGLAATLYSEYSRGVGLGSKISFDKRVKGLSMNTGLQVRDDKSVVIGIGLSYKKDVNLGKGWSMTPMFSAGGFIPLGHGAPELAGSGGFSVDIAKRWITEKGVAQKIGVDAGVTVMTTGTVILSTGLSWYRDKLAGIESREQEKRGEMASLMKSILDEYFQEVISKTGIKTPPLDLENPECRNIMKRIIKSNAEKQGVPADKLDSVVDATIRLLLPYQGASILGDDVRNMIAAGVADQYAMAWAEDRKAHISDSTYLSGANLGAFWVVGSPLVGIYAGVQLTKHKLDGYGDRWGREYGLDHQYEGGRNETLINSFNQEAGFRGNDVLKISEVEGKKYVMIPKHIAFRVHVNENLHGKMKKDAQGNVLLHVQTPMAAKIHRGAATQGSEIIIGGKKGENFSFLDKVGNDWFTNADLNEVEILNLGEGIRTYNAEIINKALAELKTKFPAGDKIQNFTIDETRMQELIAKANEINSQEKPQKVKLTIDTDRVGNLVVLDPTKGAEGRGLEIEYRAKFEMIDQQAKQIANDVYAEALKVRNPRALNAVKHDKPRHRPEYDPFNTAMQSKDYQAARSAIKVIFVKLDKQIPGAKFAEIGQRLDNITDNNALGQALMSINNIFARSTKVRGGGNNYEFKGYDRRGREVSISMGSIIKEREGQISRTIENYNGNNIDAETKKSYKSLIDASAKYRVNHPELFNKISAPAAQLNNTVGFNLGDKTNPENPLFNPEIYNPMVDLNAPEFSGENETAKNTLHKRAMELFANNKALIAPILKALGIQENQEIKIGEYKDGTLKLDIGGKIITLKANMNFGYFTQCVNHTVILSDISANTEDGTSVQFNSGVWEGDIYKPGNVSRIDTTIKASVGIAVTVGNGEKQNDQPPEDNPESNPGSNPHNTQNDVTTDPTERLGRTPTNPTNSNNPNNPLNTDYSGFSSNDNDGI